MRSVTGSTRLAGVIGHPLDHTLSPAMHNAAYEDMDLDWIYVPLHVADTCDLLVVLAAIRALPFVGVNVTMPYKQTVMCLCDEVAETATLAGAVNTIECSNGHLVGYNTDGRGLVESLADAAFVPQDKDVVIIGAGGAGAAALISLALAHSRRVTVLNRDAARAEELVRRIHDQIGAVDLRAGGIDADAESIVRDADLVVNSTPVGMCKDDPSPIPTSWLRSGQVVADMVYKAHPTALVQGAREAGAVAIDGLGMLVCQGATAIDIWHHEAGARAPRDVMRAAAMAALGGGGRALEGRSG